MSKINFKITTTEKKRIDLAIAEYIGRSRSYVAKSIHENGAEVNGEKTLKPNKIVGYGDKIVFEERVEVHQLVPQKMDIDILYEDDNLLAINKKAGVVVHPGAGNADQTLMNGVLSHLGISGIDNLRGGLIHRLDKDTSGVILVSKNSKALEYYSKQFADREVEKTYVAVVAGDVLEQQGSSFKIDKPIARSKYRRREMTTVSEGGREATTSFEFLGHVNIEQNITSAVFAKPETGRTHQIRVHLASIGLPILGDKKYGVKHKHERMLLHAYSIRFKLLGGSFKKIIAPLPYQFSKLSHELFAKHCKLEK